MDAAAEGRQEADPPVAELVAEALQDDRPVRRQAARRLAFLDQVGEQVGSRPLVEIVVGPQPGHGRRLGARPAVRLGADFAGERAERPPELDRATHRVALPERDPARLAGCRRDEDPIVGDRLDAPGAGAEQDDFALARLVDHLLVQLAHPPTTGTTPVARPGRGPIAIVGQVDPEEATIGDRAARRDGHRSGVPACLHRARHAIPHQARPQLGELVRRVIAGQHADDRLERVSAQLGVVLGTPDEGEEVVERPGAVGGGGHDLLRQHVERIARDAGRLDGALVHPARNDGRLEEVAAILGEDDAARWLSDVVAGAPDALEPACDRRRRLDLDHQIDGAHIDAKLKRAGGHDARQPALLESGLDLQPLLPGDRAVVGANKLFAGQLVELEREALGQAPAVGEDDRAPVSADELQDARVDRRPDARPRLGAGGRPAGRLVEGDPLAQAAHVLDRHHDLELERLPHAGIDDRHRPWRPWRGAITTVQPATEIGRHSAQRSLRRRKTDALRLAVGDGRKPLQGQRQVGAALRARQGMDLVDDQPLDAAQGLARGGGQQQVKGLGRGDQDVGRQLDHPRSLGSWGVACPDADAHRPRRLASSLRGERDALQRRPEVAVDVMGQGLER